MMKFNRQEIFKNVAWLGVTLLIAGGLRFAIQETLGDVTRWLLIAGAVLLAIGVAVNFAAVLGFFGRRGTKLGTNTAVLALAVLGILVAANVLAARHVKRFDLTEEKLYSLSDQTRKIVSGLKIDVTILKFDKEDDTRLRELVAEYRAINSRVRYEFVDPQEKPELARQYKIARFGEAVAASGARTERVEDTSEEAITNALLKLTRDAVKTICFVQGHGERSTENSEAEGYAGVEALLKRENYQLKNVNLVTENGVPPDCTALVIAGPRKPYLPQEIEFVKKGLEAGGKIFFLLDPEYESGFEGMLAGWRVEVGKNTVVDASGFGRLIGTGPAVPLVLNYGSHPVTKELEDKMSVFAFARSVKAKEAAAGESSDVTTTELLKTSEASWAETNLEGGRAKYDEGRDTKGPVSLGVAVSKKIEEKEARLVVIGDSDFASNRYLSPQLVNRDLFVNAVNWLAQDEDLISVRPKSATGRYVTLTRSQQNLLFWFTIVFLPGAVVLTGTLIWYRRR
jgi:ABC-type uncharacterized transport system involved in gliding motility auxiliary subunit